MIVCEICGAVGDEADAIYFPSSDLMKLQLHWSALATTLGAPAPADTAMLHGVCIRIEVESGNMRIIDDRIIESLQLYCTHFGLNVMPNKIGDDEHA
jgi:hypothetical protein